MALLANKMTTTFVPALSDLAPNSGAYLNEVNLHPCPSLKLHPNPSFPKVKIRANIKQGGPPTTELEDRLLRSKLRYPRPN